MTSMTGPIVTPRFRTTATLAAGALAVIGTHTVGAATLQGASTSANGTSGCGPIYSQPDRDMHTAYDRPSSPRFTRDVAWNPEPRHQQSGPP